MREKIFSLFRNPAYPVLNEPVIPSSSTTGIEERGIGTDELKLPYYPGDGINYPGSPAQWFAIPPLLYEQWVSLNLNKTPKAFANFSPRLELATTLGNRQHFIQP